MPIGGSFDTNTSNSESSNLWWNYTNDEKDNYMDTLEGTVVEIHEVLSTYQGEVLWFPQKEDGTCDPKKDWLLVIRKDDEFEPTELRFSEGKHKSLWQQLWYSAIFMGEPEPPKETDKKYKLPDMLAGAKVKIYTQNRKQWPTGTKARPWRAMILAAPDPQANLYRGFFEDWKTDTRYTESEQYKRNKAIRGDAKKETEAALSRMKESNPELANKLESAYRASTGNKPDYGTVYDQDIPF